MEKWNKKVNISFVLSFFGVLIIACGIFLLQVPILEASKNESVILDYAVAIRAEEPSPEKFQYLSDIPYIKEQSNAGWKTIELDKTADGNKITVRVENGIYEFDKGIWAHATSTVVYDLSNYDYDYDSVFII